MKPIFQIFKIYSNHFRVGTNFASFCLSRAVQAGARADHLLLTDHHIVAGIPDISEMLVSWLKPSYSWSLTRFPVGQCRFPTAPAPNASVWERHGNMMHALLALFQVNKSASELSDEFLLTGFNSQARRQELTGLLHPYSVRTGVVAWPPDCRVRAY